MPEVVQLPVNNLNDIPAMLRKLADRIESGDLTETKTTLVIIPVSGENPILIGYGDINGQNDPMIQLQYCLHWLCANRTCRLG